MLDEVALQRLHSALGSVRPEDPDWSAKVKALLLEQGITPADLIELLKAGIHAELQRPPPSPIEQAIAKLMKDLPPPHSHNCAN
jgi:hypothetical protein